MKTNTPYPSRKIRCIRACTHQRPQRKEDQYAVSRRPIRRSGIIVCEYFGRYQTWSLLQELQYAVSNPLDTPNYGVTCEDEAKRRNSRAKTKTFEENAAFGLRLYHFTYPERKLTMEEMLYKFIDEGKREHEEMRKTNELDAQPSNKIQTPPIPFPRRLRKEKEEAQQKKFLENLKQLHINLPFIKTLAQMPKYAKFLKDMPEDSRVPIILGRPFLATAQAMIDVFNKKITLRVGDNEVIFHVDQSIKRPPTEDDECYEIDDLDDTINAEAQELLVNDEPNSFLSRGLEKSNDQSDLEDCEPVECNNNNDSNKPIWRIASINTPYSVDQKRAEPVKVEREQLYSASANEIDEKKPELKDFPHHLKYAYLHDDKSFPIIISSELSEREKISLLQVLEKRKGAISWKMSDIKGISPSYCTHKILMEDDFKPVIQPQRRLNPKVQDVVKNEIVKLLDSWLIYPISASSWVSPIHVVPKKGGMTVVLNDDNELIPSRMVTGWRDSSKFQSHLKIKKRQHSPVLMGLLLTEECLIKDKRGTENLVADHLSRLENSELSIFTEEEIADEFPNKHLMALKTEINNDEPWTNWGSSNGAGNWKKFNESHSFWPSIFKDAKDYVMRYDACQRSGNISSRSEMPQNNI
ncbi:hypothetical protein Tco_0974971 [Tanacetum coccineum]|uniref:Reverse transcriptase domain-containing protein n=1 Tax=Tanacetum coccineum TaxID=301880 RepID=A0ABQ5ED18_9ASTR